MWLFWKVCALKISSTESAINFLTVGEDGVEGEESYDMTAENCGSFFFQSFFQDFPVSRLFSQLRSYFNLCFLILLA